MKRPRITGLAQLAVLADAGIDLDDILPPEPWPILVLTDDDGGATTWHANHRCDGVSANRKQHLATVTLDQVRAATIPGLLDAWTCPEVGLCSQCGSSLGTTSSYLTFKMLAEHTGILWLLSELLTLSGTEHLTGQGTGASAGADASTPQGGPQVPDYDGGSALHPEVTWDHLVIARVLIADLADVALPADPAHLPEDPSGQNRPDWAQRRRVLLTQILDTIAERADRLAARLDPWAKAMAERDLAAVAAAAATAPALPVTAEQIAAVAAEDRALLDAANIFRTWASSQAGELPEWIDTALAPLLFAGLAGQLGGPVRWRPSDLPGHRARLRSLAGLADDELYGPVLDKRTVAVIDGLRAAAAALPGDRLVEVSMSLRDLPDPERVSIADITGLAVHRVLSLDSRRVGAPEFSGDRQLMLVVVPATAAAARLAVKADRSAVTDFGPVQDGDSDEVLTLAADLWWSEYTTGGWADGSTQMTALARLVDPTVDSAATGRVAATVAGGSSAA